MAAVAGRRVLVADAVPGAAERAIAKIREWVKAQVEKGRLDADPEALDLTAVEIAGLSGCDVVVEAIVEELGAKQSLFAELERIVGADCMLASNSSSLTPTAMAAGLAHPGRLVGLHFFNPGPATATATTAPAPCCAAPRCPSAPPPAARCSRASPSRARTG